MADRDDIKIRRKRVRFRCWHRGSRESDLLLGRFADHHLDALDSQRLSQLEALLAEEDPDIWDWALGRRPVPAAHDTPVMALLRRGAGTDA
jgi:antitoxin CptB